MGFFLIFNGINSVATKYIIPTEFKITLLRMLHKNQVLKTKWSSIMRLLRPSQ